VQEFGERLKRNINAQGGFVLYYKFDSMRQTLFVSFRLHEATFHVIIPSRQDATILMNDITEPYTFFSPEGSFSNPNINPVLKTILLSSVKNSLDFIFD